jgi:hypothetical protein
MNIIEQAAKRLEELQRAGVDVPWVATGFSGNAAPAGAPAPAAVHDIAAGRAARTRSNSISNGSPAAA